MMRRLIVYSLCIYICITGCTSKYYWYNPNKSINEAVIDCRECKFEAQKAIAPINSSIDAGFKFWSLINSCMESREYRAYYEQSLPPGIVIRSIMIDNMNSIYIAGMIENNN